MERQKQAGTFYDKPCRTYLPINLAVQKGCLGIAAKQSDKVQGNQIATRFTFEKAQELTNLNR